VFARPHLALVGNQGANKESYMKKGIHPEYMETTVRCSCGNTWTTHSTVPEMRLDLCDKCHPFYTGTQKLVDTGGRVQRFADKFGGAAKAQLEKAEAAKQERAKKAAEETAAHAAAASAKAEAKAARAKAYAEKAAAEEATKKAEAATEEAAAEAEATVAEAAEEAAE
jgi:large subunit ribosomal protein L31